MEQERALKNSSAALLKEFQPTTNTVPVNPEKDSDSSLSSEMCFSVHTKSTVHDSLQQNSKPGHESTTLSNQPADSLPSQVRDVISTKMVSSEPTYEVPLGPSSSLSDQPLGVVPSKSTTTSQPTLVTNQATDRPVGVQQSDVTVKKLSSQSIHSSSLLSDDKLSPQPSTFQLPNTVSSQPAGYVPPQPHVRGTPYSAVSSAVNKWTCMTLVVMLLFLILTVSIQD